MLIVLNSRPLTTYVFPGEAFHGRLGYVAALGPSRSSCDISQQICAVPCILQTVQLPWYYFKDLKLKLKALSIIIAKPSTLTNLNTIYYSINRPDSFFSHVSTLLNKTVSMTPSHHAPYIVNLRTHLPCVPSCSISYPSLQMLNRGLIPFKWCTHCAYYTFRPSCW